MNQEEEDRRKRESRAQAENDDEDLEKALKLSREEEELRKQRELSANANSLFDDTSTPQASQPTGFNQGYTQGSAVDFFANPIDQNQMQPQATTGYMGSMYTGFPQQSQQPTGFQNGYTNGFSMQPTAFDPFGQPQQQQMMTQMQQHLTQQPTSFNPYGQAMMQQQQQQQQQQEPAQPGSNNPFASTSSSNMQIPVGLQATPTGSNNPFAQSSSFNRPQTAQPMSNLASLPEQRAAQTFTPPPNPSFGQPPHLSSLGQPPQQPQRELSEHEAKLNALLSSGDGMDTFGNTGNLRIPAQHTAPGTFVNSAGANLNRLNADATGNNPFLKQQFTSMPQVSYNQVPAATGPAGGYGVANPFARQQQSNGQSGGGDLIQL